jgi:hypothetical protein
MKKYYQKKMQFSGSPSKKILPNQENSQKINKNSSSMDNRTKSGLPKKNLMTTAQTNKVTKNQNNYPKTQRTMLQKAPIYRDLENHQQKPEQ